MEKNNSEEPTPYLERIKERLRVEKEELDTKRDGSRVVIERLAEEIYKKGARKVWLLGSYQNGDIQRDSDIELVVSGLSEPHFDYFYFEKSTYDGYGVEYTNYDDSDKEFQQDVKLNGELITV
jgi:predicted nucleotidyltransferase